MLGWPFLLFLAGSACKAKLAKKVLSDMLSAGVLMAQDGVSRSVLRPHILVRGSFGTIYYTYVYRTYKSKYFKTHLQNVLLVQNVTRQPNQNHITYPFVR